MVIAFLPYPSFSKSVACLDRQRLGKQRVEAKQLISAVRDGTGWKNHPAARMWEGCLNALILYYNITVKEWISRGYNNTMEPIPFEGELVDGKPSITWPWWLGWAPLHMSHRASLLRKHPEYYKDKFEVPTYYQDRGYIWPSHHSPEVRAITSTPALDRLFAPVNLDTSKNASKSKERMYTVAELREMCAERGITGISGKGKAGLMELLNL